MYASWLPTQLSKLIRYLIKNDIEDFPGGAVVKNPPANAGDTGSSPGPRTLVRQDPTCCGATKPVRHNY